MDLFFTAIRTWYCYIRHLFTYCTAGPKEYKLEIQHMVISPDSEYGIYGNLQMDDVTYNSVVVYRFDDLMSAIQADINMERKISMTFMVNMLE